MRIRFGTLLVARTAIAVSSVVFAAPCHAQNGDVGLPHEDLTHVETTEGKAEPITSVDAWERRRIQVRDAVQEVMGPLPTPREKVPLDVDVIEDSHGDGYLRRKVAYHTDSPTARVRAWLFIPEHEPGAKLPAVLCLHQTTPVGKDEPAGVAGQRHFEYAKELAGRGFVTLAPDYPSFGEYPYDFDHDDYQSGSMKAMYDNIRAVDLLQSLPEVDAERIGCIGHSLGGHNSIFTAFFEPRIKAVVSSCGFTQFSHYKSGDLTGWTSARYMPRIASEYGKKPQRMPFDFTELVAGLAPRAFLAIAPTKDDNFDVEGVRRIVKAAAPIYQLYHAEGALAAEHPDIAHDFPPEMRKKAYEFLEKHLAAKR
jgi:acetyl esterase/lipase